MKKIYLSALALMLLFSIQSMMNARHSPAQSTVYLFDFHDVLAKQDRTLVHTYIKHHIHPLYFLRTIGGLIAYGLNKAITFNTKMLSIDYALLHNVTNEQYRDYALHVLNPFVLDSQMLAFAQELKTAGSQIFLFSNVGSRSLAFVDPEHRIETLFTDSYICNENTNFTTKQSPEAFKMLLQKQIIPAYQAQYGAGTYPQRIIMIDDSPHKIAAAQQGLRELQQQMPVLATLQLLPVYFKNMAQMKADLILFEQEIITSDK